MQRTYLPLLALSAAIAAPAWAASVFTSQPLDQSRFAVLAQPVGKSDWKLLVLEQIKPEPLCWEKRSDGLIDPALNRFDFSGICSRYIDSNGYSLRVGDEDLASRYRLRLEQQGNAVKEEQRSGRINLGPGWGKILFDPEKKLFLFFRNAQCRVEAGTCCTAAGLRVADPRSPRRNSMHTKIASQSVGCEPR